MTWEQILAKSLPALIGLADRLEAVIAQYPDSEASLRPIINAVRGAATPEGIVNLASVSLQEIKDLIQTGEIKPRQHPSDLA